MQTLASRPANLLLVSHWVSLDALNPEVEDELAACAANEAAISILYDSGRQKDERAVERVASLATRCPILRERQLRIAGGIMATDRFILVSGFDILGTPGFLQQDPRQRRLEAGILVHSPGFAAEISRLYGHQGVPSAHGEDRPGDAQSPAAEGLTSQDHRDLQRLFSDLGKGKGSDDDAEQEAADAPTERMLKDAALLALDQGHWKLFDAFVRRLPSRLGCRAVATLLGLEAGSEGQGTDQREYDQWRSWLIKEKWKHQQFVEATLLLIGDRRSDGDGLPTLELARAASICGMKDYTEDRSEFLIDAFDCKYDPDRAIAWNCIATLELLVHAVPEANEVLRYLEPQVPNSWKAWNRLLISWLMGRIV